MKEKLLFWWYWMTNKSFRGYVYEHDMKSFRDRIENMRRDMLEHQSRTMFSSSKIKQPYIKQPYAL
jgi:hypothetical protein